MICVVVPVMSVVGGAVARWMRDALAGYTDDAVDRHTTGALEAVGYQIGRGLLDAGGHNIAYVGLEAKFMWREARRRATFLYMARSKDALQISTKESLREPHRDVA